MISKLFWGWFCATLYFLNSSRVLIKRAFFNVIFLLSFINYGQTPIWLEDFNSYADGTTVGTFNRWTITTTSDINSIDPDDYFKVVNKQLELRDSNWNEQVFTTESIDISSLADISLRVQISESGNLESIDYAKVFYSIDTGSGFGVEIPFSVNGENANDFNTRTIYQAGLIGLMIKIVIRLKNSADTEYYRLDNISVQSEEPGYFDSDNDGVFNNIDIDDDNDGILDEQEELSCLNTLIGQVLYHGNSEFFCDTDNDGIANIFDLDSDDDGIPDVVESGLGMLNNGAGYIDYTNTATWLDDNADGCHDAVGLTYIPINSDGDSVPDYLDLDSDNDTIFDVDESQAGNSSKTASFENGDADITGDGTADYSESELFREKDSNDDGIVELFGDGIQDVYEHFNGVYGNSAQEAPLHSMEPLSDDLPDYIDVDSDNNGVYDISVTMYEGLDLDTNGVIDDISDFDGDGIVDLFDTDDTVFGSPRSLNSNLYVHFDGRNDYVQDENLWNNASQGTLMAWINIDDSFSSSGFIMGQHSFNISVNASRKLEATVNGASITYNSMLNSSQWIHVAAIFDGSNTALKLYINGLEVTSNTFVSSTTGSDSSLFTVAKNPSLESDYFFGGIEEVRVFTIALTALQLRKMVYQKIKDNGNLLGEVIPFDIDIPWGNLVRYFRMDAIEDDIIDDRALTESVIDRYSNSYSAKCFNIKDIRRETAPMPFITTGVPSNLDLGIAVSQNNDVRGGDVKELDWSITHVKHDVELDFNHSDMGLLIDSGVSVNLNNDTSLHNNWYLKLDGVIDLNGESQLIQTANSYLDVNSLGYIERDQQGSANSFTYNYWSSPVSFRNSSENNKEFYLKDVLFDGTIPNAYSRDISFGPKSDPYFSDNPSLSELELSSYWIWRFVSTQTNEYAHWEWIGSGNESGSKKINVTEGYSMKGTAGLNAVSDEQNYVFIGKPNNAPVSDGSMGGDLIHTYFDASFDPNGNPRISFTGNPFPSAIDANKFIDDNASSINGQLYFWEHWGGNSHVLKSYQGGYAILNKAGGVAAPSHPDVSQSGSGTKTPKRYIPVGQGFFVIQKYDVDAEGTPVLSYGGNVIFKNSHRIFAKESSGSSLFIKGIGNKNKLRDSIQRIRLIYEDHEGFKRPLMLAFLKGASDEIDYGYDAVSGGVLPNDVLFMQENSYFVIQSFGEFDTNREIPISIFIDENGGGKTQRIYVDQFENLDINTKVFVKDRTKDQSFEITNKIVEFILEPGEYKNRFSLVFQSINRRAIKSEGKVKRLKVYLDNLKNEITLRKNSDLIVNRIVLLNSLGQIVQEWNKPTSNENLILQGNLATGMYYLQLETSEGKISKKIIIK